MYVQLLQLSQHIERFCRAENHRWHMLLGIICNCFIWTSCLASGGGGGGRYSPLAVARVHFIPEHTDLPPPTQRLVVEDHSRRRRIVGSIHDANHLGITIPPEISFTIPQKSLPSLDGSPGAPQHSSSPVLLPPRNKRKVRH